MSDGTHIDGHELATRLTALAAAPDRRDWRDVEARAEQRRRGRLRRFAVSRRPVGMVAAGVGVAALAVVLVALLVLTPDAHTPNEFGTPGAGADGPRGVLGDFQDNGSIDRCHARVDYDAARRAGVGTQYGDLGGAIDIALENPALVGTDAAPCPPTQPAFTVIPVTPRSEVPASVVRTLGLRPDTPVVKLGSFTTPDSTYTIWRARNDAGTVGGRYIDSVQQDGGEGGVGQACVPRTGAVFPEDPQGSPARIAVPGLVGLTVAQARSRLRGIGLRLGTVDRNDAPGSRRAPDGFVVISVNDPTPASLSSAIDALSAPGGSGDATSALRGEVRATAVCSELAGPQGATSVGGIDSGVSSLELTWRSGPSVRIPVENGAFVASTPDADCSHLDRPDAIVLRDGQDREIGRVATDSVFPYLRDRPISRFDPPRCRPGLGDPGAGFAVLTTGAPVPPDAHTGLQGSSTSLVDWTTARVARHDGPFGSYGTVSFVVARSRRDMPGICLVAIAASGRSDAQCPSLAEAASGLAWSLVEGANSKGLPETGPAVLSGLVPDGVVEVRDGPRVAGVEGNVWAIFLPNGARVPTELTFTRSDGTQRTVERPHP